MPDWDKLRREVFRIIAQSIDHFDDTLKSFTNRVIERLKANGWTLDEAAEVAIGELSVRIKEILTEAINGAVAGVAAGAAFGVAPDFIERQMADAFSRRWHDDLTLSDRLWRWNDQTRQAVLETVAEAAALRRGVGGVIFDMQRAVEREAGAKFKIVSDRKPLWIKKLEQAARRVIRNPAGKKAWDRALNEASAYIDRLADTGTRQQTLAMLGKIKQAVETGHEKLITEAIRWRMYDKQLYNLKRIARTEISTAYHRATLAATADDDLIIGYRWRLSASHPDPDICDWFAGIDFGLGKGIWPKDRAPQGKGHPHCLCTLIPVTRPSREKGSSNIGELMQRLPEASKRQIAPRWARDLNGLGIDWDKMTDPGTGWFARKKDIAAKVGEDRFQAMQSLGQSLRNQNWGTIRPRGRYRRQLLEMTRQHTSDAVARRVRRALERDQAPSKLDIHYLKRRYQDGLEVDGPEALNRRYHSVINAEGAHLYRHTSGASSRWIAHDPDSQWVAVFGMDGRRITAYPLEGEIPDIWEYKWPMTELKTL